MLGKAVNLYARYWLYTGWHEWTHALQHILTLHRMANGPKHFIKHEKLFLLMYLPTTSASILSSKQGINDLILCI
jgi:hypothetical protein